MKLIDQYRLTNEIHRIIYRYYFNQRILTTSSEEYMLRFIERRIQEGLILVISKSTIEIVIVI